MDVSTEIKLFAQPSLHMNPRPGLEELDGSRMKTVADIPRVGFPRMKTVADVHEKQGEGIDNLHPRL